MSYLVLARKYRPQSFDEVVGQQHITDLLKKAIESERVAHAYLFCGPRGIGKTSCARIFAKSLNCENGPTLKPCGKCPACVEITAGRSFDVLEIDGASNRGIDEIRALRENVKFAPGYGRFKIYIIDEVHMLTTEAFNALLKTLEEPPSHVKFIFATTAPNKVPATIISRCQRFDFKRISLNVIVDTIASVSKEEGLKIESGAKYAIGKASQGSLRDALSILDQLSSLSEREIVSDDIFSMLGIVETRFLFELIDALAGKNCISAIEVLEQIIDKGKDIKQLAKDIVGHFRNLMIVKIGGKSLGKLVDYPVAIKEMFLTQSSLFTLEEILTAIDTFIHAQDVARITESLRMPLEVALARLTYVGEKEAGCKASVRGGNSQASAQGGGEERQKEPRKFSPADVFKNKSGQVDISGKDFVKDAVEDPIKDSVEDSVGDSVDTSNASDVSVEDVKVEEVSGGGHVNLTDTRDQGEEPSVKEAAGVVDLNLEKVTRIWDSLTHAISKKKMSIATYLQEGTPIEFNGSRLVISFPEGCSFHKECLEEMANVKLVEEVFSSKLKVAVIISYKLIEAYSSPEEDDKVKSVLNSFSGKVVNRWHND